MISIGHNISNPYAQYGLNHFLFKYGIRARINQAEKPDIGISYGAPIKSNEGVAIQILPGEIERGITGHLEIDGERIPLFETPKRLDATNNGVLATFLSGGNSYPCITTNDNSLVIGFDIFNEIGYTLAGHLESIYSKQDSEGEALIKIPVVDALEELLFQSLMSAYQKRGRELEAKPFWPDGKKFSLCLTHDVDRVYKTYQYIQSALRYIRERNLPGLISQVKSYLFKHGKDNPYWNFCQIMDLENELKVKSTFFFLDESGKLNPFSLRSWILFAGRYKIDDPDIIETIRELHKNGFEIGIHGSYYSYKDLKLLEAEKEKLERILNDRVCGIRQHYLNFDSEDTFRIQESLGFKYDSTLGFSKSVGFRRGTCFPFYPLLVDGRQASLLEIPLVIVDSALSGADTFENCVKIMRVARMYGGVLTLLWHQRVFNYEENPTMVESYKRLIEEARAQGAWITNACGLCEWLAQRSIAGSEYGDAR